MTENLAVAAADIRSRSLIDAMLDAAALVVMAILAFLGLGAANLVLLAAVIAFNADRWFGRRSLLSLVGYNHRVLDGTRIGRLWTETVAPMVARGAMSHSDKTTHLRRVVSVYDQAMYVLTYWCPFLMFAGAAPFFKENGSLTLIVLAAAVIITLGRFARAVGIQRKFASE